MSHTRPLSGIPLWRDTMPFAYSGPACFGGLRSVMNDPSCYFREPEDLSALAVPPGSVRIPIQKNAKPVTN